jgi:large subunit ribosomal protein L23
MHLYEVLKRPLITEKVNRLGELVQKQYAFEVDRRANKLLVKQAVEEIFEVNVESVRIINVAAHRRRNPRSRMLGHKAKQVVRKPGWKKAIVKLAEGQRLDLFEGV